MKINHLINKNQTSIFLILFFTILILLGNNHFSILVSQETTQEEKVETKKQESEEGIIEWFVKGGATMIYLGIIASMITGFAIERYFFFKRNGVKTKNYFENFNHLIQTDFHKFEEFVIKDNNIISRVLRAGVVNKNKDISFIEKQIETNSIVELGKLEKGLNLLSNLGNLAPLLGFFGTVVGMRHSFIQFTIKAAPTAKDLAAGVEEALITTQAGLLIAIPTFLIYNLFLLWIDSLTVELERCSNIFMLKIQEMKNGNQN